ncbi:MAG: hypothetical protein IH851_08345 [Armatimonadetes bacterium]|nr:hypothetical protein [Armatimonadota bacterium]
MFVYPNLQNSDPDIQFDDKQLSKRLDDALRELTLSSGRGRGSAFAVRTNLRDLARGFYQVGGSYLVDGDAITIRCRVWTIDEQRNVVRVGEPLPEIFTDVDSAGEALLEALRKWLASQEAIAA